MGGWISYGGDILTNDKASKVIKIKCIEIEKNIDLVNPPNDLKIDDIEIEQSDIVALFKQDDSVENGFYILTDKGFKRIYLTHNSLAFSIVYLVNQGNNYNNTLWVITNDKENCLVGTDKLYTSLVKTGSKTNSATEIITITDTDVDNGYIDLNNKPNKNYHTIVAINGILLTNKCYNDTNYDYNIDNKRLNFEDDVLFSGAVLSIYYYY